MKINSGKGLPASDKHRQLQAGQTLIEVLAALSIAVVVLLAIGIAVISALNNAQFTKNQNLANHYAEQGMEVVRNIWNSDLPAFNSLTKNYYCLDKNTITLTDSQEKDPKVQGCSSIGKISPQGNNVDSFAREVDIFKISSDCVPALTPLPTPTPMPLGGTKVVVRVSWLDNKCTDNKNLFCHKVELVSCFSKTYTLQTP